MRRHRRAAPLAAAALACLAAAAPAGASEVLVVEGDRIVPREDPLLPPPDPAWPGPPAPPALPRAGAPPIADAALTKARSVRGAVQEALDRKEIDQATAERYLTIYTLAKRSRREMEGRCRYQLSSVIRIVERIARERRLITSRMPALFESLKRNRQFWRQNPEIAGNGRTRFGGSPLIWQHYPGLGVQLQPLGNFGKANAIVALCKGVYGPDKTCPPDTLRRLLDSLYAMGSRRGGLLTFEYFFPFGGGQPPWMSGMAQATAVQAFANSSQLLNEPRYLDTARSALQILRKPPPLGARINAYGGIWFAQYSFAPGQRVLNAHLQTIIALHDYAEASKDADGRVLWQAGNSAAQRIIKRFDTGKWSLYELGGGEAPYGYQQLVTDFLSRLCDRLGARVYCRYAKRFARYLRSRPAPGPGAKPQPRRCGV